MNEILNMSNYLKIFILLLSTTIGWHTATAKGQPNTIFNELNYKEAVEVTVEVDIDKLTADWRDESKHRAVWSYKDRFGQKQFWNVKLEKRGHFRRMNCAGIPPLKVFFDKEMLKQKGLAKYNDFKLVNYCHENDDIARELLFKEYLAYRLYNQLSEESFRVQLLKIVYKDIRSNKKWKQWAFIIEDTAELKDRIGAKGYEMQKEIADNPFDMQQLQLVSVFQYMIGNADWDALSEKNVKMLERNGQVIAVPYDFDFSGLVNPPYGRANTRYDLTSMTERVYLGATDNLEQTIQQFERNKSNLFALIIDSHLITDFSKQQMLSYLRSFYDHLTTAEVAKAKPVGIYTYGG